MISNGFWLFSNRRIPVDIVMKGYGRITLLVFYLLMIFFPGNHLQAKTQINNVYPAESTTEYSEKEIREIANQKIRIQSNSEEWLLNESAQDTVPRPSKVLMQSLMIPGWGQVTNEQVWKVPIIYGMIGGLVYFAIHNNQNYKDYRAAYYNSQYPDGDMKFGPTPDYLSGGFHPEALRHNRNFYRNRRDMTIIGVVLAYGLNVLDAYVFAHMRDFDVSDSLAAHIRTGRHSFDSESNPMAHVFTVNKPIISIRLSF
ncbi:DUF5683 domain-containing protein [Balneolaceae bacterium ANBcel3]|nr:DUF5683 domain-containing protein [Balneolaceae bacterium ANBcel3]